MRPAPPEGSSGAVLGGGGATLQRSMEASAETFLYSRLLCRGNHPAPRHATKLGFKKISCSWGLWDGGSACPPSFFKTPGKVGAGVMV